MPGDRSLTAGVAVPAPAAPAPVAARALPWLAAAALVACAAAFNAGHAWAAAAFGAVTLGVPVLGRRAGIAFDPARAWRPGPAGWGAAGLWAALLLGLPFAAGYGLVRGWAGAMFLWPAGLPSGGSLAVLAAAAVAEEFFFRAWLQESVFGARWGGARAGPVTRKNLAAASVFAAAHALALGPLAGLGALPAGLVFGWVMERSRGGVWPAAALHAASNAGWFWLWAAARLNAPQVFGSWIGG